MFAFVYDKSFAVGDLVPMDGKQQATSDKRR